MQSETFMGKPLACCFHAHSDVGSLDGSSTVDVMVQRMKEVGMSHVTFTEHGTLNSAASAYRSATKHGLKCIHGAEAYLYWPDDKYGETKTYHITIFFKTKEAYEMYCKLTPLMYTKPRLKVAFGDAKGCIYWEDFLQLVEKGIVVGTACIGGWLNGPIIEHGDIEEARKRLDLMIATLGVESIYDEWIVDDLTSDIQKTDSGLINVVNEIKPWFSHPDVIRESNRIRWECVTKPAGIKRLASQDAHYAQKEDKLIQDNKRYGSDWIMSFYQHIKGAKEYSELAKTTQGLSEYEISELIDNTHLFASQFGSYSFLTAKERGFLIPEFNGDRRAEIYSRMGKINRIDLSNEIYRQRLEYEMNVLSSSPLLDGLSYMLLANDIALLAKENGILVNCRGSAGGCLLAFGLGISVTDPIPYDLPFERFLTEGRLKAMTPPDIDIDISDKDKLLMLMKKVYGDRMLPISTDTLLKPRSAMKDIERYKFGKVRQSTEILTKTMPSVPQGMNESDWLLGYEDDEGTHVPGEIERNPALQKYANENKEIWSLVTRMCGVMRQKGIHACICGDTPVFSDGMVQLLRNARLSEGKPISVWSTGVKPTISLVLNNGICLTCTSDHRLILKDGREVEARHCLGEIVDYRPFGKFDGEFEPGESEAFVAGWLLGDGSANKGYFTPGKDDEPRDIFIHWLTTNNIKFWFDSRRRDVIHFGKNNFPDWMKQPSRIFNRRFHSEFWSMTASAQKAYVSGFMSANGWCLSTNGKIAAKSVSINLISDLATYMNSRNLSTCLIKQKSKEIQWHNGKYVSKNAYTLEIGKKFYSTDVFEFKQRYKQQNLEANFSPERTRCWSKTHQRKDIYVKEIQTGPTTEVFDFNEPKENRGYIGGILVHNCAVLISPEPIHNIMPVYRVGGVNGELATGFGPKDVEYVGGLKVDILRVSALETIHLCNEKIRERGGEPLEWGEYPHVDEVYQKVYWPGATEATFQTKTTGITNLCLQTKPCSIKDLSNLIALYRPSSLDWEFNQDGFKGNAVEYYIQIAQGKVSPFYVHPDIEPIFKETLGVPIYQESVLRTFRDIGGMSYEQAEMVRRAIGKKDMKLLSEAFNTLAKKCEERGWSEDQISGLKAMILASARYSFNKSHSASYGIVSYATAYLKHFYPLEFWCAELTVEAEEEDKIRKYATVLGDLVVQPQVGVSHYKDWLIQNEKLIAPLVTIKGCGTALMEDLNVLIETETLEELNLLPKPIKEKKPSKRKAALPKENTLPL